MKNYPKKFNLKKALNDFDKDPDIQDKVRNNIFDIDVFAFWLTDKIPAYQANWTNCETIQRINKYLK